MLKKHKQLNNLYLEGSIITREVSTVHTLLPRTTLHLHTLQNKGYSWHSDKEDYVIIKN